MNVKDMTDEQCAKVLAFLLDTSDKTYGVFMVYSNDGKAPGFHIVYDDAIVEAETRSEHNKCGVGCGIATIVSHNGHEWEHNTSWVAGECVEDMIELIGSNDA